MARSGFTSIEGMATQAKAQLAQGRWQEAERSFRQLVSQTHVIDYEYDDWLRQLAEIYSQLKRPREAGCIYLYLHYFDLARSAFQGDELAAERARVCEVDKSWKEAAALYRASGLKAHAAIAYQRGGDFSIAVELWEEFLRDQRLRACPYERALAQFNLGTAYRESGDNPQAARRAMVESLRYLEQVADEFETQGERERAFDCYQILVKMGRDSGQYENLAEGYLNSIRVLRDDGLKFYVLQYYEDFIDISMEREEFHAAATLFQEAADYSAACNLPYAADYQAKAGAAWTRCAEENLTRGAPVEMVENAYLAAIACFSAVGQYKEVRSLFITLGKIEALGEKKAARYAGIAARYENSPRSKSEATSFPDYLKKQHAYADIWFVDLLEWELEGDPGEVAMSIIGDLRYPDAIRRRALVVVLSLADAKLRNEDKAPAALEGVTELLGELQSYAALSPLEKLFEHPALKVRQAAVRALRFLYFKRSFALVRRALRDPEPVVREAAVEALRGLHFPHAFNPLVQIFRETDDPQVRAVAIQSIGKIQSVEAGEFLLSILRVEEDPLRQHARDALAGIDNSDLAPIIQQYFRIESNPQVRKLMSGLLGAVPDY